MYVKGQACVRVKGDESELFSIASGVRQKCLLFPQLFNDYMDGAMKKVNNEVEENGKLRCCWTLID